MTIHVVFIVLLIMWIILISNTVLQMYNILFVRKSYRCANDSKPKEITEFNIKLLNNDTSWMPTKAHDTDAGFDLYAREVKTIAYDGTMSTNTTEAYVLHSGQRVLVMTGVAIALSPGWEAQIRPRSGLALKHGINIVNSPGTIDAGYRNEIGVILFNSSSSPFTINIHERIAQMVIKEVPDIELQVVDKLDNTNRGLSGFGSSGNTKK